MFGLRTGIVPLFGTLADQGIISSISHTSLAFLLSLSGYNPGSNAQHVIFHHESQQTYPQQEYCNPN